jgi:alpha-galactosidase
MIAGYRCAWRVLLWTIVIPSAGLAGPVTQHAELQPTSTFSSHVNGVPLPVMGWNPWNAYRTEVDEAKIMAVAARLVSSGLAAKGYRYVTIDDGWWLSRGSDGRIRIRTRMFPSAAQPGGDTSFRPWVDRLHSMGLKAGLYTEIGRNACSQHWDPQSPNLPEGTLAQREVGTYGFQQQDIHVLLQDWDFDFLKVDACGLADYGPDEPLVRDRNYRPLGPLIVRGDPVHTDRDAVEALYASLSRGVREARPDGNYALVICSWGEASVREWGKRYGTSWRTSPDLEPTWKSMLLNFDSAAAWTLYAGPGHWNDADMLGVGLGEFDAQHLLQARAHMSMWAMLSSPLILGNRLAAAPPELIELVGNPEVIAVDQDVAGNAGSIVLRDGDAEVMVKTLSGSGVKAVALINRGARRLRVELPLERLGLSRAEIAMRDLWSRRDLPPVRSDLSFWLAPYETRLLRVVGKPLRARSRYLGEIPARINMAVDGVRYLDKGALPASWVPARVDYAPSGAALSINGTVHRHGLGVLANSRIELDANDEYRQLRILPAVLDSANSPTVTFRVYGDGRLLWQHEQPSERKPEPAEISVGGVKVIELVAEAADAVAGGIPTTVAWADAEIIR